MVYAWCGAGVCVGGGELPPEAAEFVVAGHCECAWRLAAMLGECEGAEASAGNNDKKCDRKRIEIEEHIL